MLAKKPEIVICIYRPASLLLKEVCAGIEEEGCLYRVEESKETQVELLAKEAADESTLGVGIGISLEQAVFTVSGLQKEIAIGMMKSRSLTQETVEKARIIGKNSARFVKKLPLVQV